MAGQERKTQEKREENKNRREGYSVARLDKGPRADYQIIHWQASIIHNGRRSVFVWSVENEDSLSDTLSSTRVDTRLLGGAARQSETDVVNARCRCKRKAGRPEKANKLGSDLMPRSTSRSPKA